MPDAKAWRVGASCRGCPCVAHLPHEAVSSLKAEPVPSVPYTLLPKVLSTEFPVLKSLTKYLLEDCLWREISLLA